MRFLKMQGLGNDFVVVDGSVETLPGDCASLARRICDRRMGVGADGLLLVLPEDGADARMIIHNADGSRADMCGNGLRCVARFVADRGAARGPVLRLATDQGMLEARREAGAAGEDWWRVAAGVPELERERIPMTGPKGYVLDEPFQAAGRPWKLCALRVGNPHGVVFTGDIDSLDLPAIGPAFELHPAFPSRINISFVEVLQRDEVRQRTFERGVGETLACGTGASAVMAAGLLTGRTDKRITIHLRGGDLVVEWPDRQGPVFMIGPAEPVFEGNWS